MALAFLRFMSSLQFATEDSSYCALNFKPNQVRCLEAIYLGRDVIAILPTGYGKSVIFHLLPSLFKHKLSLKVPHFPHRSPGVSPIVIVVSPLNALIHDQIKRLGGNTKATSLRVAKNSKGDLVLDTSTTVNLKMLREGKYEIVFTHPEAFLSCKEGMELFQSTLYQKSVQAVVIDEAHCILEWGYDFRKDYSQLTMLCATFPGVPVVALTATATRTDITLIRESLNLKSPKEIIGNPNRQNIFYDKLFRRGEDAEFFVQLLQPIADELQAQKLSYPLTILYLPLRWCGFAFKFFARQLGSRQYYPADAPNVPENRLFAQYNSPQTNAMKEQILKELTSSFSKVRVIFATVALGMGVDISTIRHIIHVGPPRTVREYFQETGRAGRDGKFSTAVLYYNHKDIAKNRKDVTEEMRNFCRFENNCLREFLLNYLDASKTNKTNSVGHLCCGFCKSCCECLQCLKKMSSS